MYQVVAKRPIDARPARSHNRGGAVKPLGSPRIQGGTAQGAAHRGSRVASKILEHIIKEAKRRAYDCLNLETGAMPEFAPARALYIRYRFEYRGPFAEYLDDPNSVFMTKKL